MEVILKRTGQKVEITEAEYEALKDSGIFLDKESKQKPDTKELKQNKKSK